MDLKKKEINEQKWWTKLIKDLFKILAWAERLVVILNCF